MPFPVAKVLGSISFSLVFQSIENLVLALAELKKACRNRQTNEFKCQKEELVYSKELESRFSHFINQLQLTRVRLENSLDTAASMEKMLSEVNQKILECNSQKEMAILLKAQTLFLLKAEEGFNSLGHLEFTATKLLEDNLQED